MKFEKGQEVRGQQGSFFTVLSGEVDAHGIVPVWRHIPPMWDTMLAQQLVPLPKRHTISGIEFKEKRDGQAHLGDIYLREDSDGPAFATWPTASPSITTFTILRPVAIEGENHDKHWSDGA